MGLFQEYLDAKGKLKKPVVDIHGGKPTPETPPTKPPKEHGSKPYISKGSKNSKKGFGDLGDYEYQPGTDQHKDVTPAKIPTAEQAEIVALVTDALKRDASLAENLVYQLRTKKLLGTVLAEMLEYKETYQHITEVMGHKVYGPKACSKLVRAMREEVAPPFSASLEGEEEEDTPDEAEEGDDEFANASPDDMEGIDGEMDMEMDPNQMEFDPNTAMQDPLMQQPNLQQPIPGQAPMAPMTPPGQAPMVPPSPAMMNFQRAMMSRR